MYDKVFDSLDDIQCEDVYVEQHYDELERDWDEPFEPETNDNWYEEQYDIEDVPF